MPGTKVGRAVVGAGVAVAGLAGVPAQSVAAPALFTCKPSTAANQVEEPPPLWELTGQAPPDPALRQLEAPKQAPCPPGQLPQAVPRQGPHWVGRTGAQGAAVPPPQAGSGFFHAGAQFVQNSAGASFATAIAQPAVSATGAHSLSQLAMFHSTAANWTVEFGWTVDPGLFGNGAPHMFAYVNKDNYVSNGQPGGDCYDCHFTQTSPTYYLGMPLTPTTTPVQFAAVYRNGHWWLWFVDMWVGYLDSSFWPGTFSSSQLHQFFGEVFDPAQTSQMGNGWRGTNGNAAQMNNPIYFIDEATVVSEAVAPGDFFSEGAYNVGNVSSNRRAWKFGGPTA
jgi:hypothetical protein